ncbi:hypothetical protein LguiB_013818 [Lonicera macranthoides]
MIFSGSDGGGGSLAKQIITGRWFMVFASFLIMSAAGETYMLSLYFADIKSSLGYDQTTINLLSFFTDLGTNVGILSCLINEVTPAYLPKSSTCASTFELGPIHSPSPIPVPWSHEIKTSPRAEESCWDSSRALLVDEFKYTMLLLRRFGNHNQTSFGEYESRLQFSLAIHKTKNSIGSLFDSAEWWLTKEKYDIYV